MLDIYIDADGCPVKQEVFRVAQRYGLMVTLVANSRIRIKPEPWLSIVVVDDKFDAADDWIVDHLLPDDIVITGDILLASRCLKKEAIVLGLRGGAFTKENIGDALSSRELHAYLRESGIITGGPSPFAKQDRSRFLSKLDETIQGIRRKSGN